MTAVACALWVWMGSMALAGRGWARIVSSVFFGAMCLLLIDFIHGFPSPAGLEWLVGLAAIILVWQRAAGQFYAAPGQARGAFTEPRQ